MTAIEAIRKHDHENTFDGVTRALYGVDDPNVRDWAWAVHDHYGYAYSQAFQLVQAAISQISLLKGEGNMKKHLDA